MRLCVLVVAGGCARDYVVSRQAADQLRAVHGVDLDSVGVAANNGDEQVYLRASRIALVDGGTVRARIKHRMRYPRVFTTGLIVLGLGTTLEVAGAAVLAAPHACSPGEELCGFGQALQGVFLLGLGGGVGLVGLVLTAVGANSAPAQVSQGDPGLRLLPR